MSNGLTHAGQDGSSIDGASILVHQGLLPS